MEKYNPEVYWSRVGQEIQRRGKNDVAGDDDPYYRYKRQKFLSKFLDFIDFQSSKLILELGCGPGGNLKYIVEQQKPKEFFGVDISQTMIDLANQNLSQYKDNVKLYKIDGKTLPFEDQSIDLSFTVTVLQHNTDAEMFSNLVRELCRVTKAEIVIMEDIGDSNQLCKKGESFIARQVDVYRNIFEEYDFKLVDISFLNTKISKFWRRLVYKIYCTFVNRQHKEGEPVSTFFKLLIGTPMFLTRYLDDLYTEERDLTKMCFQRKIRKLATN